MTDRELLKYALNTLIVHQGLTRPLQITGDCIKKLQDALAQPDPVQVRPAEFIATASIGVGADVIGMPMIWAEWPTPESSTVKWSIPVDPNNFGEPITFMGQYVGEGKVVSASFGLPKGAFEFAPPTGKGEASKIKHSLEPQPEQLFKYTPYGLRSDENGKLSIGEISQREWVGLTDDEIEKIVDLNTSDDGVFDIWCDGIAVAHIVCAKLKEKNA